MRLNYPEAVALLATQILELIRDGHSVAQLMELGKKILGHADVLDGIASMIDEVQVEGTFLDGSKLVTVHHPIASEHGDMKLALYGSFLPLPKKKKLEKNKSLVPGETQIHAGHIILNEGRKHLKLKVINRGDRPIQVGSHYHFIEVNRVLIFDRKKSYGMRLDIPAGTAVRFEPGESKTIKLVEIAGNKIIQGGNSLATGPVTEEGQSKAFEKVRTENFGNLESKRNESPK